MDVSDPRGNSSDAEPMGTESDTFSLCGCLGIRKKILVLTRASAVRAGHQLLSLARLPVGVLVAQAEVTVVVGDDGAVGALLSCRQQEIRVRKRAFSHLFLMCDCQGPTFVVV